MKTALEQFAELLEKERIEQLHKDDTACQANIDNAKTSVKPGKKYTKVDIGYSGAYMVVNDWYWGSYRAYPKN